MDKCGSKNGHQKYMSLKETGLHAVNMLTIPRSIVNIVNIVWRDLNEHKNLHVNNELYIHTIPNITRQMAKGTI